MSGPRPSRVFLTSPKLICAKDMLGVNTLVHHIDNIFDLQDKERKTSA